MPVLGASTGCDFLDSLTESSAIVDVFATSHATPDAEGNMPERNGEQLVFANDMGWEIYLDEATVTTQSLSLESCDGERFDVEMYWGALAEAIPEHGDYEALGVGGVRASEGSYCSLIVGYGPSDPDDSSGVAAGSTVYLAGTAIKDDVMVEFAWRTELALDVDVDLGGVQDGEPFRIGSNENFSKKLTVAKAYDRFFDGVDFAAIDELGQADIDALVADTLSRQTVAFLGTGKPG
ncbi:hypothetical protein ACNOYE_35330 [Nannocystaceae bacterium ST9]